MQRGQPQRPQRPIRPRANAHLPARPDPLPPSGSDRHVVLGMAAPLVPGHVWSAVV